MMLILILLTDLDVSQLTAITCPWPDCKLIFENTNVRSGRVEEIKLFLNFSILMLDIDESLVDLDYIRCLRSYHEQ